MAMKPAVVAVMCVGLFLIFETLVPKAMALSTSNINDYRMKDQSTHKRRNYMLQRDKRILGNVDNVGVTYDTEALNFGRSPEDLSAFIVDYANMMDDVVLLDKSVETRTRKRGNFKVEKHNNQAIPDLPCNCKHTKQMKDLGADVFPRFVETRICDKDQQGGCLPPYVCKENYYDLQILRMKQFRLGRGRSDDLPGNLSINWVSEFKPVSVGCTCTRDYIKTI